IPTRRHLLRSAAVEKGRLRNIRPVNVF
ncbi:uncharacterized protein METZ01_LOCUS180597, partial [marine metagenome]